MNGNYPFSSVSSREDAHGIKCNLKANPGEMHLLEKCVIFIGKQPILVELSEVSQVLFSRFVLIFYSLFRLTYRYRVGNAMGTARTFDLSIETKAGTTHMFNAVNRDEHEMMDTYLKTKKIKVTNQMADETMNDILGDDDDEEMQSVASSGSEEPTVRRGAEVDEDSEEGT